MEHRSQNMRSLYRATAMLSTAVLLVASLLYGWALSRQFQERSLADLEGQAEQLRLVLNQKTERARHHVGAMQLSVAAGLNSHSSWREPQMNPVRGGSSRTLGSTAAKAGSVDAPWDGLDLADRDQLGSLFVHPSLVHGPQTRALNAVMSMLPGLVADHTQQGIYQWSYYYDVSENWSILYPALPRSELLKATGSKDMAAALKAVFEAGGTYPMRLVGPLANPSRRQVWTTPYMDAGGKGMMVSLVEPVYMGSEMAGAVGTDITLRMLDSAMQAVPLGLGRAMVVDPSGLLLADSGGRLTGRAQVLRLQELGSDLVSSSALFGRSSARLHHESTGVWISHELDGTPWRLFLWVGHAELRAATLLALSPYIGLELLFIGMLLWLAWWQHRRFTKPAMALAVYVEEISRDLHSPVPSVPAAWKPWFDQVASTASERQSYLDQTQDYADRLELKVGERTSALEQANHQLEEAMRSLQHTQQQLILSEKLAALGKLTAGVAHELNTPLGNVLTAVTTVDATLIDLRAAISGGQARRSVTLHALDQALQSSELAQNNVNRALVLVRRFRQLGELHEAGSEQAVDLRSWLQGLCRNWSTAPASQGRLVELECPETGLLVFDTHALTEALSQLVENAFVHGLAGVDGQGRVRLKAEIFAGPPQQLLLRLSDNGCGLSPQALHHLFDPFYTSHMGKGNGGLGAYLAYLVVSSRLGGSIHASSEPGEGLTVEILLPVQTAGAGLSSALPAGGPDHPH